MAYEKKEWVNDQTLVNAENMNHIEEGVYEANQKAEALGSTVERLDIYSHTHINKSVLDKFGEKSGTPTYAGNPIGGGSGTVTGVKMNGSIKTPTDGVVDLGTVITEHQDISGKVDNTAEGINDALLKLSSVYEVDDDFLIYGFKDVDYETPISKKIGIVGIWNYIKSKIPNLNVLGRLVDALGDGQTQLNSQMGVEINVESGSIELNAEETVVTGDLEVDGDFNSDIVKDDKLNITSRNEDVVIKSDSKSVSIKGENTVEISDGDGNGISVNKSQRKVYINVGDEGGATFSTDGLEVVGDVADSKGTLDSVRQSVDNVIEDLIPIDKGEIVKNSYVDTTGNFVSYSGWDRTDYIDISNFSNLVITSPNVASGESNYNVFYKADKSFLSNIHIPLNGQATIPIPKEAKYVAFSMSAAHLANFEIKAQGLKSFTSSSVDGIYGTDDYWASKTSWAKDEICIDDNKLWKCLISNSNKPTEGSEWTQISLKAVTNELRTVSDTASQYAYGSVTLNDNYSYLKKSGNNVDIKLMVTSPVKNVDLIMTVPTDFRPKRQEWGYCFPINGGNIIGRAYVHTDGKIYVLIPQNINDSTFIHISFIN